MQELLGNSLAPRPGLEPGTYGLTVEVTVSGRSSEPMRHNEFHWGHSITGQNRPYTELRTELSGLAMTKSDVDHRNGGVGSEPGPNGAMDVAGRDCPPPINFGEINWVSGIVRP